MLGGLVSWVTTGLLRATGSLVPRATVHQERDTTDGCSTAPAEATAQTLRPWCSDGSMGTSIVNGHPGAACGVWGRGCRWAYEGRRGHAPLWHTRWRCEVRVSASTVAMVLQWTCAHAHNQARARHATAGRIDMTGTVFQWTRTRAAASARPQNTPRGHRRARCTGMPCLGRRVTNPQGSTGGPGTSCMRHIWASVVSTRNPSIHANPSPRHWRGPPPKGR